MHKSIQQTFFFVDIHLCNSTVLFEIFLCILDYVYVMHSVISLKNFKDMAAF